MLAGSWGGPGAEARVYLSLVQVGKSGLKARVRVGSAVTLTLLGWDEDYMG